MSDLDKTIAISKGLVCVGQVLYYLDPESGDKVVSHNQQEIPSGVFKTYQGEAFVADCICSETAMDGLTLIHGHTNYCLRIIPEYSTDPVETLALMNEHTIGVYPGGAGDWVASWQAKNSLVVAPTISLAVAQCYAKGLASVC